VSSYEDYGRAALDYDDTRIAVGADLILGAALGAGIDLAGARVLDAGCGTGAYAFALAPHVGELTLVDADEGMLEQVAAKLSPTEAGPAQRDVEVHRALLPNLPFEDGRFDLVMVHQVLHHLGDVEGGDWAGQRGAVAELARLVAPGGMLVVHTCSQEQLRQSYWYYALIPEAADALRRRYAPLDVLEQTAADGGLEPRARLVPVDAVLQGDSYFDGASIRDPAWRNGDSAWTLASDDELARALERVDRLEHDGALAAFVAEHDRARADVGQLTFLTATRPR
jgi:ubiquinone/menaquinone biosynthesis C-methylase UbiE